MNMTEWVTTNEAADTLDVSPPSTVSRMIRDGELKAQRHGSTYRVDKSSVAFLLGSRRASGPRAMRATGVPAECADLIQSVNRIHMLKVQAEVELRALEAEGRAAE